MNPETIFQACNQLALACWALLILTSPFWPRLTAIIPGVAVTLLAITYSVLIFTQFQASDLSGFSSITGIKALFQNDLLLTAGWIHYLAFDLLIGCRMVHHARNNGISHWVVVPCLLCTFMLGPFGWLLYQGLRFAITKKYFVEI